jgi:hypothetical protein
MAAILTPALALRYLRQLSTDVRAAVVVDGAGVPLAGEERLAGPAARLTELLPDGVGELVVRAGAGADARGWAVVARGARPRATRAPEGVPGPDEAVPAIVLAVGPLAPLELLRRDLATALGALVAEPADRAESVPLTGAALVVDDASRRVQVPGGGEFAVQAAIFAGMGLFDAIAAGNRGASE